MYGIAIGTLDVTKFINHHHTVERSFVQSEKVHNLLKKTQYENQYSFIGHYRFHNGVSSLNGEYSFTKFSLTEYVSKPYITVNPIAWKDLPISINFSMMATLYNGECYTQIISYNDPMYNQFLRLNTDYIVACPVYDSKHKLSGIVIAGINAPNTIDSNQIKHIADLLQKL